MNKNQTDLSKKISACLNEMAAHEYEIKKRLQLESSNFTNTIGEVQIVIAQSQIEVIQEKLNEVKDLLKVLRGMSHAETEKQTFEQAAQQIRAGGMDFDLSLN